MTVPVGSTGGALTITNAEGSVTTDASVRVLPEDRAFVYYEDFESDLGEFLVVPLASNREWDYRRFGENGFAEMSGFRADTASDDWLISPAIDLPEAEGLLFEYVTARNFAGPDLEVLLSTDWTGGSPTGAAWTPLGGELSPDDYAITSSGPISLDAWAGETVRIAFRYTSEGPDSGQGATYQVHDFLITQTSVFESGWVDHPELGETYLFSPSWAFHPMVGYVHVLLYPWMYHPELGWVYHAGGHPDTGAWFYSVVVDEYVWSRVDLGGVFYFEDGTTGLFFE